LLETFESKRRANRRKKMKQKFMNFLRSEKGLTTVEYAVAGALVAAAVVAAFNALGLQVGVVIAGLTTAIGG
jgi:pilus assembly protein Flp/PilA